MHPIRLAGAIFLMLLPATLWAQAADGGAPGLRCSGHDSATWGEGEFQKPATPRVVEFSVGVKAGAGAELYTEPSDTTLYTDPDTKEPFVMPFFDETRSGYNVAFGVFGEVRFVQYVGVEVGLMFVRHKLLEDTDWTYTESVNGNVQVYTAHTKQTLLFTKLNVPILLKGYLPVGKRVRLSLGIGPELAWSLYSRASFELDKGVLKGKFAGFKGLSSKDADDIGLVTAAGVVVDAGVVKIPIELRFSYNFSQASKYQDRVTYDQIPPKGYPTQGALVARDTMYGQLLVGLMYDL
jgi:hypothetical protein